MTPPYIEETIRRTSHAPLLRVPEFVDLLNRISGITASLALLLAEGFSAGVAAGARQLREQIQEDVRAVGQ